MRQLTKKETRKLAMLLNRYVKIQKGDKARNTVMCGCTTSCVTCKCMENNHDRK